MALKYFCNGFEHPNETEQFGKLLPIIDKYYCNKEETAYFIGCGELKINNRALDALLISPKVVVGIEFKNYGDDGDYVKVVDNDVDRWYVYSSDKKSKYRKDGTELYVEGGANYNNPYSQAFSNRQQLSSSLRENVKDVNIKELSKRVPFFIVFNKEIKIMGEISKTNELWLKIVTNSGFIDSLNLTIKDKTPILTDSQIRNYLSRWGFRDFHDPSEWSTHKKSFNYGNKEQSNNTFGRTEQTPTTITTSYSSGQELSQLSRKYMELARKGDIVFLFLMSFVMTFTMAQRWWWDSQKNLINIIIIIVVSFLIGLFFVVRSYHKTRPVPKSGEYVNGIPLIKGLNKFSFGAVLLSHFSWMVLAALFCVFMDPLRNLIPANSETFYGSFYALLRTMCVLLKSVGYVIGGITIVSFIIRLLSINSSTFHNQTSTKDCLSMMPCTRSDISIDGDVIKDYWADLWRWFRVIIVMSAYVALIWVGLTLLFDMDFFKEKYRYWPLKYKTEQVDTKIDVEPTKTLKSFGNKNGKPGKTDYVGQPKTIKIRDLHFSRSSIKLRNGESYNLRQLLVIEPQNATESLSWSVANSDYLSIDAKTGIVTSNMYGSQQFTVTVSSKSGNVEATIMVNGNENLR